MSEVRIATAPPATLREVGATIDRLRTIVQDSHLNFLVGAGTPSAFFERLGNIEVALTEVSQSTAAEGEKQLARASIQGYFFRHVLLPNLELVERADKATPVLKSYATFLRTLNRILLGRRSSLLGKHVNIFTTNVDLAFEVALELMGIDYTDGFAGKIWPKLDIGEFGTLRLRQGLRFEHRSEIPVIDLYKIHGSAGWKLIPEGADDAAIYYDHGLDRLQAVGAAFAKAEAELLLIDKPEDVDSTALLAAAKGKQLSPDGQAFADAYAKLPVVNPEKSKFATTVLNQTYYELIRRFANELEKENSVLFVHGFSFRDEHLRDLVLRAARLNPTLQVIVFCYSRADKGTYEQLMVDSDIKNGNILFLTPAQPAEGSTEAFLTLDEIERSYFAPLIVDQPSQPDHVIELDVRVDPRAGANA